MVSSPVHCGRYAPKGQLTRPEGDPRWRPCCGGRCRVLAGNQVVRLSTSLPGIPTICGQPSLLTEAPPHDARSLVARLGAPGKIPLTRTAAVAYARWRVGCCRDEDTGGHPGVLSARGQRSKPRGERLGALVCRGAVHP